MGLHNVNIKLTDNKKVIWQIFMVWEFYKENMRILVRTDSRLVRDR